MYYVCMYYCVCMFIYVCMMYVCMYVCMYVFMYVRMSACEMTFFPIPKPVRTVLTNVSTNRMSTSHSGGIALSREDILLISCRSLALNAPKTRKGTETPSYHAFSFMS